jgi:hypothetical protein
MPGRNENIEPGFVTSPLPVICGQALFGAYFTGEEQMNKFDTNAALMEVAKRINGFLEPAGGYVSGETTVIFGIDTPAVRITVVFPENRLKEYITDTGGIEDE